MRVAYTINNFQPVQCTIISDQPLFYMDFEGEMDIEEELSSEDLLDLEALEKGLAELDVQEDDMDASYKDLFGNFDTDQKHIQEFGDTLEDITKESYQGSSSLEFIIKRLEKSRLAKEYLEFAYGFGTKIISSEAVNTAQYDRETENILVNPNLNDDERILLIARELRRVWQHRNGALLHPLSFHPDHAILVNRAQIADLTVSMVRIAWELQLADDKGAWERLETSTMADLTRTFARECHLDFRSLNNGIAASAVFEAWFLSERCRHMDNMLIQQMLADYRGYVFGSQATSLNITAELTAALGTMPYGKNYLAPYVETIISDPIFVEVRDRSNANFLWFIKFEQSFQETEHELQGQSETNFHDGSVRGNSKKQNDWLGKNDETENVIILRRDAEEDAQPSRKKSAASSAAQIISLGDDVDH